MINRAKVRETEKPLCTINCYLDSSKLTKNLKMNNLANDDVIDAKPMPADQLHAERESAEAGIIGILVFKRNRRYNHTHGAYIAFFDRILLDEINRIVMHD